MISFMDLSFFERITTSYFLTVRLRKRVVLKLSLHLLPLQRLECKELLSSVEGSAEELAKDPTGAGKPSSDRPARPSE